MPLTRCWSKQRLWNRQNVCESFLVCLASSWRNDNWLVHLSPGQSINSHLSAPQWMVWWRGGHWLFNGRRVYLCNWLGHRTVKWTDKVACLWPLYDYEGRITLRIQLYIFTALFKTPLVCWGFKIIPALLCFVCVFVFVGFLSFFEKCFWSFCKFTSFFFSVLSFYLNFSVSLFPVSLYKFLSFSFLLFCVVLG